MIQGKYITRLGANDYVTDLILNQQCAGNANHSYMQDERRRYDVSNFILGDDERRSIAEWMPSNQFQRFHGR